MSLLAILISLILERSMNSLRDYRQFGWFDNYTDKLLAWSMARGWRGPGAVVLIMAGPVLAVIVLNAMFDDVLLGLLSLAFSTVVLFLCLGPQDLEQQVERFLAAWEQEDEDEARAAAEDILGEKPPEALSELHQQLLERVLLASTERLLAPIFCFTLFAMLGAGPLGVVLYRLGAHLQQRFTAQSDEFGNAVRRFYAIMGWLPAHAAALLFAMAGSFVDTIHQWRERSPAWRDDWQQAVEGAVLAGGLGALQVQPVDESEISHDEIPSQLRAAMGMLLRSMVILVVVIAIITLTLFGE